MPNASITVSTNPLLLDAGALLYQTRATSAGRYRFEHIVRRVAHGPGLVFVSATTQDGLASLPVVLPAADLTKDLVVRPTGTLLGAATAPAGGMLAIAMSVEDPSAEFFCPLNREHRFDFKAIPQGTYEVWLVVDAQRSAVETVEVVAGEHATFLLATPQASP